MILTAVDLLRTEIERSCDCRAILGDLARDFPQPPDAVVLTLLSARPSAAKRNASPTRGTTASAYDRPDLTVLIACYYTDYSVALKKLEEVIAWVGNTPLIGPISSQDGRSAMLQIVPFDSPDDEARMWKLVEASYLPSICVQLSVRF